MLNPLCQCEEQMVDAKLCTWNQVNEGKELLLDRMTHYYERKESNASASITDQPVERTNKWSKIKHPANMGYWPSEMAAKELQLYISYNDVKFLPVMEPLKVLGAIDENGQPREPIYAFGPVMERGLNLPGKGKRNHADYVDGKGYYNLTQYLDDMKEKFPSSSNMGMGQLCPHITTEVDCESLFSQAGFMSHPRRAWTVLRMYECMMKCKHRLHQIHCPIPTVRRMFLERWRSKDWKVNEERDDQEFLEVEKAIYLTMFPECAKFLEEEESMEDDIGNKDNDNEVVGDEDGNEQAC